jgi:hypothetical protein
MPTAGFCYPVRNIRGMKGENTSCNLPGSDMRGEKSICRPLYELVFLFWYVEFIAKTEMGARKGKFNYIQNSNNNAL